MGADDTVLTVTLPDANAPVFFPVGVGSDVQSDTAVLLDDGRVLYGWGEADGSGSRIRTGVAADVETFLTQDNSVQNHQTVAYTTATAGRNRIGPLSITRNPYDGYLYLVYNVTNSANWIGPGDTETTPCVGAGGEGLTVLCRSSDEGVTWDFVSFIQCFGWSAPTTNFLFGNIRIGEIHFASPTEWIVEAPRYLNLSTTARNADQGLFASADSGATWTRVAADGDSVGANRHKSGGSRNCAYHDGLYWWSSTWENGSDSRYRVYTQEPGTLTTTWDVYSSETGALTTALKGFTWAWEDPDGYLYGSISSGANLEIIRWAPGLPSGGDPPYPDTEYELLVTLNNLPVSGIDERSVAIFQQLGDCWMALMSAGMVVGMEIDNPTYSPCIECQGGMVYDSGLMVWEVQRQGLYAFSATLQVCRDGCEPSPVNVEC